MANNAINTAVQLSGMGLLSIRHLPDDQGIRETVAALGLDWPAQPGHFSGHPDAAEGRDVTLVWRSPQELLALSRHGPALQPLRDALAPGRMATAAAWNLSQGMMLFELQSPDLDAWLARLVDAAAIPQTNGHSSRCRLADVAVLLLRLDKERAWLLVDKPIAAYVSNWLNYAHDALPPATPAAS
jgi:sarcosine oxidase gamma subunit